MYAIRHVTGLGAGLFGLFLGLAAPAQGLYVGPDAPPPEVTDVVRPTPIVLGQVRLESMRVVARIRDGVATTEVHQVFANDGRRPAEGTWILPLPAGATADRFTMTVGGKPVAGEVLDARRARSIYERIVRRQRDPGLLEYMGQGCLRARVFPIPAGKRVDVQVRYSQVLPATGGLYEWRFPLRAAGVAGRMAERVSLDVQIESKTPLKNLYSPLQGLDIVRQSDHRARASLELRGSQVPDRNLALLYGLSGQDFGLHLLTWRKGTEPGFFMMMLSPKRDVVESERVRRVIHFVLDTSGSMQGEKIEQARGALRSFLLSLKPQDAFNVVPFATEARPFFPAPVTASRDNVDRALAKIAGVEARGGTNIEDGLRHALQAEQPGKAGTYVPITVFLTDGLPTVGNTNVDGLIAMTRKVNANAARIFVFGVGDDVNTRLLDTVAEDSRGDRDYVRPGEDIEVKTGALFTKLSGPVMTDIELTCDGIEGFDVFPRRTPDLFQGGSLLFVGRYRGSGHHAIRLKGIVGGTARDYVYEGTFPVDDTRHDFLPTLWAQRKVAVLLDAIRMNGPDRELLAEIERLGREYGIVTPYTSHLILEEGMTIARHRGVEAPAAAGAGAYFGAPEDLARVVRELRRAGGQGGRVDEQQLRDLSGQAQAESSRARRSLGRLAEQEVGKAAVGDSVAVGQLRAAIRAAPPAELAQQTGLTRKRQRDRDFYLVQGVWVDRAYRPEMRDRIERIEAFGDTYFALIRERPELAGILSFSSRMLVVAGDRVIEIR